MCLSFGDLCNSSSLLPQIKNCKNTVSLFSKLELFFWCPLIKRWNNVYCSSCHRELDPYQWLKYSHGTGSTIEAIVVDCHIFSGGLRLYADFPDNLSPHFGLCGLQSNGNDIDIKSFFLKFCAKLHSHNHQHITIILIYCDMRPAEPGNSHYGNFCRGPPNKKMIKVFQKKSYVHFIFYSLFRKLGC